MKYPKTLHIYGSLGKQEATQVKWEELPGTHVALEEKVDGTQVAVRFSAPGQLHLQSRGTEITGGQREFNHLKTWAYAHANQLWERLGDRYTMYGEWLYAKHTVFYDQLPHYFLEFDIWDREQGLWLSTPARHTLLQDSPVQSVPVLHYGPTNEANEPDTYLTDSLYKSDNWKQALEVAAKASHADLKQTKRQTANTRRAEGIYIKAETATETVGRYKYICPQFLHSILSSGSHWKDRPLIPNRIRKGVDLFTAHQTA